MSDNLNLQQLNHQLDVLYQMRAAWKSVSDYFQQMADEPDRGISVEGALISGRVGMSCLQDAKSQAQDWYRYYDDQIRAHEEMPIDRKALPKPPEQPVPTGQKKKSKKVAKPKVETEPERPAQQAPVQLRKTGG